MINHRLEKNSFEQLDRNPSDEFCKKLKSAIKAKFLTTVEVDLLRFPILIQLKQAA